MKDLSCSSTSIDTLILLSKTDRRKMEREKEEAIGLGEREQKQQFFLLRSSTKIYCFFLYEQQVSYMVKDLVGVMAKN